LSVVKDRGIPAVSVVIPTFNRAYVLADAIQSVLDQTFEAWELIVVDDGSADDTPDRLAAIRDRRVRWVRQPNRGLPAARNRGAALARADVIAFLDDDDCWKPDKLDYTVRFFARHPSAQALFTDAEKHDGTEFTRSFTRAAPVFAELLRRHGEPAETIVPPREMFLCLLEEAPILPSTLVVRRDAFERVGRFDEAWRSFEDWEFLIRFSAREPIGYVDRPLTVMRISTDSLHRVSALRGRTALISHLLAKRGELPADTAAVKAINRGVRHQRKMLGWHFVETGQWTLAARNYIRGFVEVRAPDLLLRAADVCLPARLRRGVRMVLPLVRGGRAARPFTRWLSGV
jgi:glycosyltransferase involved in cell wall biosynthesis